MPYLNRLLQDSGVSIPARPARPGLASSPGTTVASPEVVETIELGSGAPAAAERAGTRATEATPARVPPPASAADPAARRQPPSAAERTGRPPEIVPSPAPARRSASTAGSTAPSSLGSAAASRPETASPSSEPGPAGEARLEEPASAGAPAAERILRTLAAVRSWTAAAPARPDPLAERPVVESEATIVLDRDGEPRVEVVPTPPVRGRSASATPARRLAAQQPGDEPEVVNLSVSIGSIELTIDGAPAAEPAPSRERPGQAGPGPDAIARLRRHYYQPPIGW